MRTVFKELAIDTLIKNFDEEKVKILESVVITMKRVTTNWDLDESIDMELSFHRMICELSDNRRLL